MIGVSIQVESHQSLQINNKMFQYDCGMADHWCQGNWQQWIPSLTRHGWLVCFSFLNLLFLYTFLFYQILLEGILTDLAGTPLQQCLIIQHETFYLCIYFRLMLKEFRSLYQHCSVRSILLRSTLWIYHRLVYSVIDSVPVQFHGHEISLKHFLPFQSDQLVPLNLSSLGY